MASGFEGIDINRDEEKRIVLDALDAFAGERGGYRFMNDDEKRAYRELLQSQMTPQEVEIARRVSSIRQEQGVTVHEAIEIVKEELKKAEE